MEYIIRTSNQLGSALKARRAVKKQTQQEVGRRVGLLPKTISGLELAPERSTVESLLKLLAALELELVLREKSAQPERKQEW